MRRVLLGAALGAAMVVGTTGTAFAGEVTGTGELTPINGFRAGSICSFSGLNDDPNEPGDEGRVQSFGDLVQEAVEFDEGAGASSLVPIITSEGPGVFCRGSASGG